MGHVSKKGAKLISQALLAAPVVSNRAPPHRWRCGVELVLPCWDKGEGDGVRQPWGCQRVCRWDQRYFTGGTINILHLRWTKEGIQKPKTPHIVVEAGCSQAFLVGSRVPPFSTPVPGSVAYCNGNRGALRRCEVGWGWRVLGAAGGQDQGVWANQSASTSTSSPPVLGSEAQLNLQSSVTFAASAAPRGRARASAFSPSTGAICSSPAAAAVARASQPPVPALVAQEMAVVVKKPQTTKLLNFQNFCLNIGNRVSKRARLTVGQPSPGFGN